MEVQGLVTILCVRLSMKTLGIGFYFTLMVGGLAEPGSVCRRESSHYFNVHLKEILS